MISYFKCPDDKTLWIDIILNPILRIFDLEGFHRCPTCRNLFHEYEVLEENN